MKTRYFPSRCFKIVPIHGTEHERNEWKQLINVLANMNKGFLEKGAGRKVVNKSTGEQEYRDVPHFSIKLLKQDGKIHTFVNLPKDKDHLLETKLKQALYEDIGEIRISEDHLELPEKHLYAFAIRGHYYPAINLEANPKIKELFCSLDHAMYCLTVKEFEDHEERRKKLNQEMLGITDTKSLVIHETKEILKTSSKWLVDFWFEEETKEKHQKAIQQIQKLLPKKKKPEQPFTKRKLSSEKNRFLMAEILFLLWTEKEEQAKQFQAKLQKWANEIQGENELEVVKVKPDLSKVAKGRIQYDLPNLCLYQAELDKFLLLPSSQDPDFYTEYPQKAIIHERMFQKELGAIALAKEFNTNRMIYMPRPKSFKELDDRVKGTIIVGEQGSGKTSLIENQILGTYLGGADNETDWKKYGRSVIAFELADGDLIKNIVQHIPEFARDNVKILNHADVENPLYVGFQDVIQINKHSRSIKKQIADTETKILLDSMEDDSKTFSVERYFKAALRASYEVGKGNLIDALNILKDPAYLVKIVEQLRKAKQHNLAKILEENAVDMKDDKNVLKTIKNRLVPFMTDDDFINMVEQEPNSNIDFWKWTNTGPYLILIYLPGSGQEISLELRKFLFTHYFIKIWLIMLARERMDKKKRRECLVIVDELHQILGQRAVQNLFSALFKEPRKYRFRFLFSIHGESSFNEAGRAKDRLMRSIDDARPNLIILKHGGDFFKKMADMLKPYDLEDFTQLMNMEYCGIFRIDVEKKAQTFMAKLLEPVDQRFPVYQEMSLEAFRSMKNALGRPREEVEKQIHGIKEEEEEPCSKQLQETQEPENPDQELDQELAVIIGGKSF